MTSNNQITNNQITEGIIPIMELVPDTDGFMTMTRNRHSNDTIKLTIRGKERLICKWDVKFKCMNRHCKNDHFDKYEQLCSYYLKGYCSFDKNCKLLHIPELYPFQTY